PSSDEYLALYYAALSSVPSNHIELLVTGLPVQQFRDPGQRGALRSPLIGRHCVREDLVVAVVDGMAVPQPASAVRAHARQNQRLPASDQIRPDDACLIVDPGHFSLDWVIFSGGFHADSSGSTLSAGQVIVSRAAAQLTRDHGVRIPEARLERAIMAGRRT